MEGIGWGILAYDPLSEQLLTFGAVNSVLSSDDNSDAAIRGTTNYHHFYKSPKLFLDYTGNTPTTMSMLAQVLGAEKQQ